MPGKKKKKFINKKDAVTFHLVHRSQQDPLQASEEAPKHVLVPQEGQDDAEKRKEEQRKFGVFYDDDYDYMQHLRDTNEIYEVEMVDRVHEPDVPAPSLQLPSIAFASEFEKPVGLLNEAVPVRGPQPDWDPDIVEALDDDFDFDNPDNQLDDDFVLAANKAAGEGEEGDENEYEGSDLECVSDLDSNEAIMSDDDDFDAGFQYGDRHFMDEETKSRFTEYSVSSSVMRRNEGLTLLDDRFEKLFEAYDDAEIGALDQEEIEGCIRQGSEVLNHLLDDFEKKQQQVKLKDVVDKKEDDNGDLDLVSDESDSDSDLVKMDVKPEEKWDCESILSTYSNLYNHPTVIKEEKLIRVKGRHGLPENSLQGLSKNEINEELMAREKMDKASTYRPKGETAEERSQRKKAVKEERKIRRQEKKMTKKAFTAEKVRQDKELVNLHKNLQGVQIV